MTVLASLSMTGMQYRAALSIFPSWTDRDLGYPRQTKIRGSDGYMGLPQDWGSGGDGRWRVRVVGGPEALPEAGAERAVVDGAADLEQPVGAAPGPAHLLRFGHPAVHQEVGRALGQGRAAPLPRPVSLGIVDQPVALAGEVVVQRPQGGPQLA